MQRMGNTTEIIMDYGKKINWAIPLLLQRMQSRGRNYWIFNTYIMSFMTKFLHEKDSVGSRLHKNIPKKIFEYDRFYFVYNIGDMHWTVLTVNFFFNIKYMNSLKGKGTRYISSIMHWLD